VILFGPEFAAQLLPVVPVGGDKQAAAKMRRQIGRAIEAGGVAAGLGAELAGTASSILGFMQTFLGGILGTLIGQAFNGTVTPLAAGFCSVSVAALLMILIAERGRLFQPHNPPV
jgi:hypothetical protein